MPNYMKDESERARLIATEQEKRLGYRRSPGFDPSPRARSPYIPEAGRTVMQPSPPLDLSQAGDPKTKRRSFGVGEGD